MTKSTVGEIRARFDADVERFSNLETGQSATIDAPLTLDLSTEAAAVCTPHAKSLLDIGCGAGNYSLKLLQRLPGLEVTLVDLSRPMLDRATECINAAGGKVIAAHQADIRALQLAPNSIDVILAAAVLHHLRTPEEWRAVFEKLFAALRPGGSFWIVDLIESDLPPIRDLMKRRYGAYLEALKGAEYRDHVFAYVAREDTPASLIFQLDTLRAVGFAAVEVLHQNACFAAFGGLKTN